ncbi:uncharacterized protein CLUP02_00766 [Colletotrichum lupini]|uniref:Uncharacterized protein n=1 Tax=Colletotrichum lupini TaxID=145971 RepID=A0A9Q8SB20_9PEZI|nr:uncharacterized protein CLUP02_00766 [Colletotrichum lupini]UQC74119.1 hypothetical protein CLUP02_00766 [Colletotrichum lupini]
MIGQEVGGLSGLRAPSGAFGEDCHLSWRRVAQVPHDTDAEIDDRPDTDLHCRGNVDERSKGRTQGVSQFPLQQQLQLQADAHTPYTQIHADRQESSMNLACSVCGYLYEYQAQTGSLSTGHPTPRRQLQVQDARRKTNSLGSIHTDTWHSQQSRTANLVISFSFPLADGYLPDVPSNPRVAAPSPRPSLPFSLLTPQVGSGSHPRTASDRVSENGTA